MKKIKIIFILISFSSAIGLKSLLIPLDAISMASSNTGIAQTSSVRINPAIISNQNYHLISASLNSWLGDINGNVVSYSWDNNYAYINSYKVEDIELWGSVPGNDPVASLSMRWLNIAYGHGMVYQNNVSLGVELNAIYSRLYSKTTSGLLINLGIIYSFGESLKVGSIFKNYGYLESDLNENYPSEFGFGLAYNFNFPFSIKLDYIQNESIGNIYRSSADIQFGHFTLICGLSNHKSNQFLSGGIQLDYRSWSINYSILSQDVSTLGTPYSIQLTKNLINE